MQTARYVFTPEEAAIIRSRCEGTSVTARMEAIEAQDANPQRKAWLATARALYAEKDDIEIDDDASLSHSDIGCWVQGWLHVRKDDIEDCGEL
jgi:hypothetical protein